MAAVNDNDNTYLSDDTLSDGLSHDYSSSPSPSPSPSQSRPPSSPSLSSSASSSHSSPSPSPSPSPYSFFGPPFYGRPPTPLPPSPSLTSLLRPSRPTSPIASDDDEHSDPATAATSAAAATTAAAYRPPPDHHQARHRRHHQHHRHHQHQHHLDHQSRHQPTGDAGDLTDDEAHPVRRASPRVPTYEYYGFILYLFSSLGFLVYLLWAYLPSPFLHALGIYYYPNRWWALAIPSFLVALVVYIYVALARYNVEILTKTASSVDAVVDGAGQIAVVDSRGRIRGVKRREKRRREGEGGERGEGREGEGKGRGKGTKQMAAAGGEDNYTAEKEREEKDAQKRRGPRNGVRKDRERTRAAAVMLDWKRVWGEGTDAVMDVPLAGVCEILYGEGRRGR